MSTAPETEPDVAEVRAKPPFLRRVRIRNYKSIAFCDVTLEPLTLLVGRNASGKSNFLDALAFLAELARVRRTVGRYPEAGLAASTTHRRFVMDGFPYAVFYRIDGPEVAIVAVAHTSRRPGYWLNR